jgi:predicted RNA-binding protein with PIN domain
MPSLIDGYNLLHALGLVEKHMGRHGLEWARRRLLAFLHKAFGNAAKDVTVVFDAATSPKGAAAESEHDGIQVLFAVHYQEADDLIEAMIGKYPQPSALTVISDDHRIQQAARRRGCIVVGCREFLDQLLSREHGGKSQPRDPEKPEGTLEQDHWIREFADLANDPSFKEVFDPYDFE